MSREYMNILKKYGTTLAMSLKNIEKVQAA